jgi:hypothetical protein
MLSSPSVDRRSLGLPSGVEALISCVFQLLALRRVILLPDCSIPPSRRQNRQGGRVSHAAQPTTAQVRCPTSIENDTTTTASQPLARQN